MLDKLLQMYMVVSALSNKRKIIAAKHDSLNSSITLKTKMEEKQELLWQKYYAMCLNNEEALEQWEKDFSERLVEEGWKSVEEWEKFTTDEEKRNDLEVIMQERRKEFIDAIPKRPIRSKILEPLETSEKELAFSKFQNLMNKVGDYSQFEVGEIPAIVERNTGDISDPRKWKARMAGRITENIHKPIVKKLKNIEHKAGELFHEAVNYEKGKPTPPRTQEDIAKWQFIADMFWVGVEFVDGDF